ncbi:MAG TPA: TIGR00282 family metallophosphoesterase [Clostridia bacterium]|jgi:metallophosphoesterase (TIGR00282 family)|nr:TIGR00282 family metallophosphoesterase [Clostridia bacterium]
MLKVLMIGDIVGRPGRKATKYYLNAHAKNYDFIIANGENAAGGTGITLEIFRELYDASVDFFTMGNHVWDKKEIYQFIEHEPALIRPANYPPDTPGKGSAVVKLPGNIKVGIVNLSGRVYMPPLDCPFRTGDALVEKIRRETPIIIVDFHAEATSEKMALGWYFDGRVSAVLGTHTHIQTADERILPEGTGYITDVGMTGPYNSVLGVDKDLIIKKFLSQLPVRFEVADGDLQFNGVSLQIDEKTGKCLQINRIQEIIPAKMCR